MGRADDRADRPQRRGRAEDPLSDQRVGVDEAPLGRIERTGLLQDDVRNGELADVVQLRSKPQLLELVGRETELRSDARRERRDVGHVGAELRLPLREGAEERLVRSPATDLGQQLLVRVQALVGDAQSG